MSWEAQLVELFDDLEGQASALFALDREAEVADRTRSEYHQVTLASRLMASEGSHLVIDVLGVGRIEGELRRVGADWLLLSGRGQDWIVREAAVSLVGGASTRSIPEVAWSALNRLGFRSALRRLAESGERCILHLVAGDQQEVWVRRVGADFVEVETVSGALLLIAEQAIACVQSREP